MARIRSIKPEFPQSESMGNISRDARLTFVLLWTLADDEGRLRGNSRMLASLLFPYDDDAPALIDGWMDELEKEGCVARYKIGSSSYVQICNWLIHQKIDKPTRSKIPGIDGDSRILANPRESSSEDLRIKGSKDQGVDQGEDLVTPPVAALPAGVAPEILGAAGKDENPEPPDTALQAACKSAWHQYADAYTGRYGVPPVRNAKVSAQVKQFVQRIGMHEAADVAAWFVSHNAAFYVKGGHAIGLLLADAEKLRTEWATGRQVTATAAAAADRTQSNANAFSGLLAQAKAREAQHAGQ